MLEYICPRDLLILRRTARRFCHSLETSPDYGFLHHSNCITSHLEIFKYLYLRDCWTRNVPAPGNIAVTIISGATRENMRCETE